MKKNKKGFRRFSFFEIAILRKCLHLENIAFLRKASAYGKQRLFLKMDLLLRKVSAYGKYLRRQKSSANGKQPVFMRKFLPFFCNFGALSAVVLFSSVLCGCFEKSETTETISLSWWGNQPRNEYTLEGVRLFQEKNPLVQVRTSYDKWSGYENNYEKLIESGNEADVMQINFDWLSKYSKDGNGYYDLNELADYIELNNFTNRDLSFGIRNGKLNAVPIAFNAIVPVFDKKAFEKYKVPVPKSWDDYFTAANAMKKDGIYPLGIGKKHMFLLLTAWFEQNNSRKAFNDDQTFALSADDVKKILVFYKRLFDEKVVFPDISGFGKNSLSEGKIAGVIAWCSESSVYADKFKMNGGQPLLGDFICQPGAEESGWYIKPATMYAIKKNTAHPEASAKLLNYLLNDSDMAMLQNCEKGIPASNKALTALMENKVLNSMEYEALMRIRFRTDKLNQMLPVMENSGVIDIFAKNAESYADGKTALDECSEKICTDINAYLKNEKNIGDF